MRLIPPSTTLSLIVLLVATVSPSTARSPAASGFVADADGRPLEGAEISLRTLRDNFGSLADWLASEAVAPISTVRSDAAGRYRVVASAPGVYQVRVSKSGYVPMLYALLPLTDARELASVRLQPDQGFELRVRDAGGAPVGGAVVLAQTEDGAYWRAKAGNGWSVSDRFGRTAPDGRMVLPRAVGETLRAAAVVPGSLRMARGSGDAEIELTVPDAQRTLEIEVKESDGGPAAGVLVAVGTLAQPVGSTDAFGRLRLDRPAAMAGETLLYAFTADGRRHRVERVLGPAEDRLVLDLPTAEPLTGRVVDAATRAPVSGALVWLGSDPGRFVRSAEKGDFVVPSMPGGRAWVQAEQAGFLPRSARPERDGRGWVTQVLALALTTTVGGRVIDARGEPLEGVQLEAILLDPRQRVRAFVPDRVSRRAASGRLGDFRLAGLDPRAGYRLRASKPGFTTGVATIPSLAGDAKPRPVDLQLLPARTGFGQVVDEDDRPIADATVTVRPADDLRAPAVEAISAADGRFTVGQLPPGRVDLEVVRDGFPPMNVRGVELPLGGAPADLGVLVLRRGLALAGRVTDREDVPLAGVEVVAMPGPEDSVSMLANRLLSSRPVQTDGAGHFRIEHLLPGQRVYLVATKSGYQRGTLAGVEVPTDDQPTLVLEPAARIAGWVRDEEGQPVPGAQVVLLGASRPEGSVGVRIPGDQNDQQADTDDEGHFAFDGVIPGIVRLGARAEGWLPAEPVELEQPEGEAVEDVVLRLTRGATLRGIVRDGQSEPIAGARLTLAHARTYSDAEGAYVLAGLPVGAHQLEVRHTHFNTLHRDLEIEEREEATLDLELRGGAGVSGRVIDAEGLPVAGAEVALSMRARRDNHDYTVHTDADGGFEVPLVAAGRYRVDAHRQGFASASLDQGLEVGQEPIDGIELVLVPGTEIVGQVRGLDFDQLSAVEIEAAREARDQIIGTVDYAGGFRFTDLGPGVWQLTARLRGGSREVRERVAIEHGVRKVERDLVFGGGLVLAGEVLFEQEPLPQTWVSVRGLAIDLERTVMSDYQGRFRFEDLEPGRYRVAASNAVESLIHNEDLDLNADHELVIELRTARVRGVVVAAGSGQPIAEAMVAMQLLHGPNGREQGSLTTVPTSSEGAFDLARMSAGRYRLRITKAGFAPLERTLDLEQGIDPPRLELALEEASGLGLVVASAGGVRPDHVTISVFGDDPTPVLTQSQYLEASGTVHFASVPAGAWRVRVEAPGAAPAELQVEVPSPPVPVQLAPAARLRVTVRTLRESNHLATLRLHGENGRIFEAMAPGVGLRRTWPLTAGTAQIDGVPPGAWRIEVIAADGRRWHGQAVAAPGELRDVLLD